MDIQAITREIPSLHTDSIFINSVKENIVSFVRMMRQVNNVIMKNRVFNMKIEWKEDENGRRSPVTDADIQANNVICEFLNIYSRDVMSENAIIISEENKDIPFEKRNKIELDAIWVVDPLDGTSSYINYDVERGEFVDDGFTVNIARLEKRQKINEDGSITLYWKPIFGIISTPTDNMVYFGSEGIGSYICTPDNSMLPFGMRYPLKSDKDFNEIITRRPVRVGVSASHCNEQTSTLITDLFGNNSESFSSGSSMKFINVFLGKTDFYPRLGRTMEWDICAAVAIGESCGYNIKVYSSPIVRSGKFEELDSVTFNKEDLSNPYFIVY